MADKTSVADWVESPAIDNDNIGGISLQENVMRPPAVNNAFREMMAQLKTMYLSFTASITALQTSVANAVPAGAVAHFYMSAAPTGWLKANGAAVSRTTYAALWAAMGSPNTGNGSTTFTLPDLRGEFLRGLADGRSVDTGRVLGSAQGEMLLQHGHGINDPGHAHTVPFGNTVSAAGLAGGANIALTPGVSGTSTTGITIVQAGGAENRPRNVALLVCIKF